MKASNNLVEMKKLSRPALCLCLILSLAGIAPAWGEEEDPAVTLRHTLVDWLECGDCKDGELEAVVELGEDAVPSLEASLELGPSPASRELLRRHLLATYQQLVEHQQEHPEAEVTMSEEEYVDTYLGNYVALYQSRAAEALAAIGRAKVNRTAEARRRAVDGR